MNQVSDRARDRLLMLVQDTGFDYHVGMHILQHTTKTEDEIFQVWLGEIEGMVLRGNVPPHSAGELLSGVIAQVMEWKLPEFLPDRSGPNSIDLGTLNDMYAHDQVEFNRWMKKLNLYAKVQAT